MTKDEYGDQWCIGVAIDSVITLRLMLLIRVALDIWPFLYPVCGQIPVMEAGYPVNKKVLICSFFKSWITKLI